MGLRGGTFQECHPRYSDLSIEYDRDTGEMAFSQKLSGKLKFIDTDYDWIMAQDRGVEILVNAVRGTITFYGKFIITSCDIDTDNRLIEVELEADDPYSWLEAHKDDTFNLVGLAPQNEIIEYRRRAAWQFYRQGDKKLSVVMGGDYFELDAEQVASYADLVDKYYFALISAECAIKFYAPKNSTWRTANTDIVAADGKIFKGVGQYLYCSDLDGYRLSVTYGYYGSGSRDGISTILLQIKNSSGTWVTKSVIGSRYPSADIAGQCICYSVNGSTDYTYRSYFYYNSANGGYLTGMFARIVHNNETHSPKYDLPTEDIVTRTLNYKYVSVPSASLVNLLSSNEYSAEPTEWGLAPDNTNYYTKPALAPSLGIKAPLYPVGKTTWGDYSWWTYFNFNQSIFDYVFWDTVQLKDAYPLDSVLSVLLDAIFADSGHSVSFGADAAHSGFFYGSGTGLVPSPPSVFITPKTNVLTANYSQKAQKGDITLAQVLNMLRDVFRCYWFFERQSDGSFYLRVEHIYWFYNGGSYTGGTPYDIRTATDPRTGKLWTYGKGQFSFDISELYKRYEFGWQDECTDWFDGDRVTCLAKYVKESATNKVKIDAFTTDLDYMLLSPEDFNKDGFALLGASREYLMSPLQSMQVTLKQGVESGKYYLNTALDTTKDIEGYVYRDDDPTPLGHYLSITFYSSSGTNLGIFTSGGSLVKCTIPAGTRYVTYLNRWQDLTLNIGLFSWYKRVNIPSSSDDVAPQNYRLAFHYIERAWYLADYPCRDIAFGDGANRKSYTIEPWYPIKKAMSQEVGLPWMETFDPYRGVLSTTGTAIIAKYEINLLSLFQKLTLMYGTDTK